MKLIPTIIQDFKTGEVYMVGYMNKESYKLTKKTEFVHFWSRTRNKIWKKGETSGNVLRVKEIYMDCDNDTYLIKIKLMGRNVCHTGKRSCFIKEVI